MYKTFSGEKGDTVGPGSYEIEKPNNWHKTGTEWSKLKVQRDFNKKDKTGKNNSTCFSSTNYSDTGKTNTKNSFYSPNSTTNNFNENKLKELKISIELGYIYQTKIFLFLTHKYMKSQFVTSSFRSSLRAQIATSNRLTTPILNL